MTRLYIKRLLAFVVLAALLALPISGTFAAEAPKFNPTTMEKLRWHVPAVTTAFLMRLKGSDEKTVAKTIMVKGSGVIVPENGFKFEGFSVLGTQIIGVDKIDLPDADTRLSGRIALGDALERATVLAFIIDYKIDDKGVTIARANWTPLFPEIPRTQMLVVHSDKVEGILKDAEQSFAGMYAVASKFSVPMKDPASATDVPGRYTIMVFVKDRIAPDSTFNVRISEAKKFKTKEYGYGDATAYHVYDGGWPVAVIPGTFPLSKAIFVKAIYQPGRHVSRKNEKPAIIAVWSTKPK